MCKECSKETLDIAENKEIDLSGLVKEDSLEITYVEPLLLDTTNLGEDISYDKETFNKGLKDGSYLAGLYTALINSGMSNIDAINTLQLQMSADMNIKLTESNNIANIEASKNTSLKMESLEL